MGLGEEWGLRPPLTYPPQNSIFRRQFSSILPEKEDALRRELSTHPSRDIVGNFKRNF